MASQVDFPLGMAIGVIMTCIFLFGLLNGHLYTESDLVRWGVAHYDTTTGKFVEDFVKK